MRAVVLLAVLLAGISAVASTTDAQKAGTPTFLHSWVKTGLWNTPAILEIGDPDFSSPGRYGTADVFWALPSNYGGMNLPPYGVLRLYPSKILGSLKITLQDRGRGFGNLYWTDRILRLPTIPTSLKGMTLDAQVLAHKSWFSGPISRLSFKDTFVLY